MNTVKKSPFKLDQFIVKSFSIERNPVKQGEVEFEIKPSGLIDKSKKQFQLTLEINVKDKNLSFDINMTALGMFKFKNDAIDATLSNYFYTNAPAIIFPYIRAYISSISALSGLHTVNLPVMNVSGLKEDLIANTVNVES